LTSHGVRQSEELAAHIIAPEFHPKPFRVYSSPFYRCLQTIQPSVEQLKQKHKEIQSHDGEPAIPSRGQIEESADLDVRLENGLAYVGNELLNLT
jgi:transcription factor C subunit 7